MRNIRFCFLVCLVLVVNTPALAIDGPGVQNITDANWGGANDLYPYAVRVEVDRNNDGLFDITKAVVIDGVVVRDTWGTGTLIAPDVVATAGHVLATFGANNLNLPAGRVQLNFGPNATTPLMLNTGGATHGVTAGANNDFAFLTLGAVAPTNPIAILGAPPKLTDPFNSAGPPQPAVNFAVGYGVDANNNGGPPNPHPRGPVTGADKFPRHLDAAKKWTTLPVENVTANWVEQNISSPEDWTEGGDSGGPGQVFKLDSFPRRAYNTKTGSSFKFRDNYAISAVSFGPTPTTADSTAAANVTYPAAPGTDQWQRLDVEGSWLNNNPGAPTSMRPVDVNIYHNLPTAAADLADPNAVVKVFWEMKFPAGNPWLANLALWEEDDATPDQPFGFKGDYALGATFPGDDLTGYGHSADKLGGAQQIVYAFDSTRISDLQPLIDDFDWKFRMNYGTDYNLDISKVGLPALNALIRGYTVDFPNNGQRAGFAILQAIPEPQSILLAFTAACAMSTVRSARRRRANE